MKILKEALDITDVLTPELKQQLKTTYRKLLEQDKIKELVDTIGKKMGLDSQHRVIAFLNDFGGINMVEHCGLSSKYFKNNQYITSITIPDNVTSIPNSCFNNCFYLQSIVIPDSVSSIGAKAFEDCWGLIDVKIGKGVKTIGAQAFNNCGFTKIVIPENVVNFGRQVFNQHDLIIITPHREGANRLNIPVADVEYYKAHLREKEN